MSKPQIEQTQVLIELQDLKLKEPTTKSLSQENLVQNKQSKQNKDQPKNNLSNPETNINKSTNLSNNQTKTNIRSSQMNTNKQYNNRNQNRRQNATTIPHIHAICKFCTLQQKIVGNAQIFICAACQNMNQCEPKFNIFICCKCQRKVTYPLGISPLIQCNACKTVNRVPINVNPIARNSQINKQLQQQYQRNSTMRSSNIPNNLNNNHLKNNLKQQVWQSYEDFFKSQNKQQTILESGQFINQNKQIKQQQDEKQQCYSDLLQLNVQNNSQQQKPQTIILNGANNTQTNQDKFK